MFDALRDRTPLALLLSAAIGIARVAAAQTYSSEVAAIVQKHCIECHRPGVGAPFTLMDFSETAAKAKMIARVTQDGTMPPWKAERGHTPLVGERGLSDAEKDTLKRWAEAGAPEGDPSQTPAPPSFPASGWRLGTPDIVVEMGEAYEVPADGQDIYRNFVVPLPELPAGKWLKGVEFRASAPSVVHHCLLDLDTEGRARDQDLRDPAPGFDAMDQLFEDTRIAVFAVGGLPYYFPDGVAYAIGKGTDLVLETHFHPSGKVEHERSVVGLYLTDVPPTRTVVNLQIPPSFGLTTAFKIPAGDPAYAVQHTYTLSHDVEAIQIFPHAHFLGKEIKCTAKFPDGREQVLVWIKHWDFAWQEQYTFADHLILPKDTVLDMTWVFDNSKDNPFNPSHPPRDVQWGQQTTDEMASLGLTVIPVREKQAKALVTAQLKYTKQQFRDMPVDYLAGVVGKEIMHRFDKNRNGILEWGDALAMGDYWRRTVQLHRGHPSFEVERIIINRGAGTFLWHHYSTLARNIGIVLLSALAITVWALLRWRKKRKERAAV